MHGPRAVSAPTSAQTSVGAVRCPSIPSPSSRRRVSRHRWRALWVLTGSNSIPNAPRQPWDTTAWRRGRPRPLPTSTTTERRSRPHCMRHTDSRCSKPAWGMGRGGQRSVASSPPPRPSAVHPSSEPLPRLGDAAVKTLDALAARDAALDRVHQAVQASDGGVDGGRVAWPCLGVTGLHLALGRCDAPSVECRGRFNFIYARRAHLSLVSRRLGSTGRKTAPASAVRRVCGPDLSAFTMAGAYRVDLAGSYAQGFPSIFRGL